MPSLYLEAGAIHGCVLCKEGEPLCYTEDVGRHNAVDKIAGWMYRHGVDASDKILYTTGRLTSEMVIKTVRMQALIRFLNERRLRQRAEELTGYDPSPAGQIRFAA